MSRIFLSHASADNREAIALKTWLVEQRPELANEIFLDIDADSGLQVGARWKGQLFESASRCEAVICLVSSSWEASHECKTEYRFAEGMGKQILVARLADTGDGDITTEWQRCDLFAEGSHTDIELPSGMPVRFNTAALYQLRKAIEGSGIGAHNFVWPPKDDASRAPYRGWEPFDAVDAGVFFGRDAAIAGGLDELRGMRFRLLASLSKPKSMFVVLGPSGSGKSSYLRAGLIPRLQREDRRFAVLGVLRPGRDALGGAQGLAAAIEMGRRAVGLSDPPLGGIKAALRDPQQVYELMAEIRAAAARRLADVGYMDHESSSATADFDSPTLVLPLDQAEELFAADAGTGAEQFLLLLAELLTRLNTVDVGLIVALTIRTDRFEALQNHPDLDGVGCVLFDDLKPMPATQFESVITGPAARSTEGGRRLEVAADLVAALLADAAEGADTLPLLALTLARLYGDYASTGRLTRAQYDAMGGMRRVVASTIDAVLSTDPRERAEQLALLRSAFIPWLATINPDNDQPLRRVARYGDLPADSRPLIDALVEKRLLVRDERGGQVVIEVALESLLRQWDELAGWLREERHNLTAADDVERNAAAWASRDRDSAWLLAGSRLTDAETLANTSGFSDRLAGARDYLVASRDTENQRLAAEEEQRQAELRFAQERQQTAETHAGDMRRRARILLAVALVAVVAAVVAVVGIVQSNTAKHQAQASARQAVALRLVSDAADRLAGHRSGGDIRAFQELLAAHALAGSTADAGMLDAVLARATTSKVADTGTTVDAVAVSPDGHRIAAAGGDHTIRLLDAGTGQQIGPPLIGHTSYVNSLAFSPNGHRLASGSGDATVRLWNADTGQPIGRPLAGEKMSVVSVAISGDGHRLASAGMRSVRVWDADTGQLLATQTGSDGGLFQDVAFSQDGHAFARRIEDKVQVFSLDTGQPIGQPLTGDTSHVDTMAFSPDGHELATGSTEGTVQVWSLGTGQPLGAALTGHTASVERVAFSPDGHRLASASDDKTLRVWNVGTGQPVGAPLVGHTSRVTSVAFAPDGHHLVSGSVDDTTVRMWDIDAGAPLAGHDAGVTGVAFSPDGHRLASASFDKTVRIWNADTGQPLGTLTDPAEITSLTFHPDGRQLATGGWDGAVQLWDLETGRRLGQPLTGHAGYVSSVAFSPDGHRLAAVGADKTVRIWNADTRRIITTLTGPMYPMTSVVYSPDGHRIASGESVGDLVWLWNADTGQRLGDPLAGHTGDVNSVAFSPDGHFLASASEDKTVRIWNLDTRQAVATLEHPESVRSVAFASDGQRLATASYDNSVRLWFWNGDTAQPFGAPIPVSDGAPAIAQSVAFSPDGQRLAAGSSDGTTRLWPAVGTAAMLCAKLAANMSHQQWHDWVAPDIDYRTQCPGLPVPTDNGPPPLPGQMQLPITGLNHPQAVTVDHSGTVYVADTRNNRIVKLPAGAGQSTTVLSGLKAPDGVAVDTAGTLYVADAGNHRVVELPSGAADPRPLITGLNEPSDVAVDTAGTVYVADEGANQVLALPAGANRPNRLPVDGPGQPNTLAVDTKRTLYVDMYGGTDDDKLLALPAGGKGASQVPLTGLRAIGGVAVDTAGNLFLTDDSTNRVVELPADSPAPTELPFSGLKQPAPIAVDNKGNLYVVDTGNNRVVMRHLD